MCACMHIYVNSVHACTVEELCPAYVPDAYTCIYSVSTHVPEGGVDHKYLYNNYYELTWDLYMHLYCDINSPICQFNLHSLL